MNYFIFKNGRIKESNVHVLCYAICVFLFAIGHTKIQKINFFTSITVTYGKFVPLILSFILIIKKRRYNTRSLILFSVFLLMIGYSFIVNDLSYVAFFLVFFILVCGYSDESTIYKLYVYGVFLVILVTVILATTGFLENDNSWYGRYDLGFTYCTFGPNLFLSATLALIAWKKEKMSWAHWIFILLLNQFFYWKTNTDAIYLSVIMAFILWLAIHNRAVDRIIIYNKIVGFLCDHAYTIIAIFTIIFQLYYNAHYLNGSMVAMNRLLSTRLIMGRNVFLKYGPELSQVIHELIFGMGVEKASYLDSSYLALLTYYGIPMMLIFCYLMNVMCKNARINGNTYLVICLMVFAVHSITDPQLSSFRANPLIISSLIFFMEGKKINGIKKYKLQYTIRKQERWYK